jgi:hypothetical protein
VTRLGFFSRRSNGVLAAVLDEAGARGLNEFDAQLKTNYDQQRRGLIATDCCAM